MSRDSVEIFAPRVSKPDVEIAPTDTGILPKGTRPLDPMKTPIDGEILVIELGGRGITELMVLAMAEPMRGKLPMVLLYPQNRFDTSRIPEVRFQYQGKGMAFAPMYRLFLDIEFVRKCGRFTSSQNSYEALEEYRRMYRQGLFDDDDVSKSLVPTTLDSLRFEHDHVRKILEQAEKSYMRQRMAR